MFKPVRLDILGPEVNKCTTTTTVNRQFTNIAAIIASSKSAFFQWSTDENQSMVITYSMITIH